MNELSRKDVDRALERMDDHDRRFLRELVEKGERREAQVYVELFHYFPKITDITPLP